MKKSFAELFLDLLKKKGHPGDKVCLPTIKEKLNEGLPSAVKHYQKYLANAEVKQISALEINKKVLSGHLVLSEKGIISLSKKLKAPELNGALVLVEDFETLAKKPVIIIKE